MMYDFNVPVFAGQGTAAVNSSHTRERAMQDASSPSGCLLLSACHHAFHSELSSLSPSELDAVGISVDSLSTPQSLLSPPSEQYSANAVMSGTTLFLIQILRYLAFVESQTSTTSFDALLAENYCYSFGVLGFSSGILPACVVGASTTVLQYISNAVEAFRLAFWIGVRVQLYRISVIQASNDLESDSRLPWSLVFFGMSRKEAVEAITQFSKGDNRRVLHVTTVMDSNSVAISGQPDVLAAFASTLSSKVSVHKTTVETLYHSTEHIGGARDEVLEDVTRRNIRFPAFSDLKMPIRCTFTGRLLWKDDKGRLVEDIVDMIMIHPVNWDRVVESLVGSVPEGRIARLINIGPGAGLVRAMEKSFAAGSVISLDLTSSKSDFASSTGSAQEPIAVVGMAVNMPGAHNTANLWEVLEKGLNTVSEIPEHRFKISDYINPIYAKNGRSMRAHSGNFIEDPDVFDNKFFKISPREARSMDPQQRVLLHTAYEALENSGYVPNSTPTFSPDTFGCYIGVATGDYIQNLRHDIDVYYSTGTLRAFLSGRISYFMQLSGPSIVIDTACSSSLVAVYQACRALMNRDCNAALAGGVNVITSPDMFLGLDRGHFLSPTGQCKAFDSSADGYSRSEGCGIFVLKRLSDAIAENDSILGVIRGVEVNQSGLAHSITHPHIPTQGKLFQQLLQRSGIDPMRINVVEAHGTGTQAGDPNELESIRSIFSAKRSSDNPLHITSIKANIGHLEAASGAAGLAKLLLMLQHRTIPKLISLKNLNPKIAPLELDHTMIDTVQTPWKPSAEGLPRMALLNNFGAAGSNGALLLEEYSPAISPSSEVTSPAAYVIGMSAKTEEALGALRSNYIEWLRSSDGKTAQLGDIAYTATARRQVFAHRLAVSAASKKDLIEKLASASMSRGAERNSKVAFVFSGQGSQYLGMGSELYRTVPLVKSVIDECHSILKTMEFPGVVQIITSAGETSGLPQMEEFQVYQVAIFSLEYALAKLWMSWGVVPSIVVGHSLGEYAAQVICGVLTLKGALTLIANRAALMVQKCAVETTGMIAINLGATQVSEILSRNAFAGASVACYNSATDSVVSGPIEQLKALKLHLDTEVHCKNVLLSVPFGYHSLAMYPLLDDLTSIANRISIRPPTIPIISNVYGRVVQPGDDTVFNAEYYARHCAEPVQFEKGISSFVSTAESPDVGAWIEIGPHTTTLPMLKVHPAVSQDAMLLGSIRKQLDPWSTLSSTLAQLYTSNINLRWRNVFSHLSSPTCLPLPSYPFAKTKFWVEFKEDVPSLAVPVSQSKTVDLVSGFSMLHSWAQFPSDTNLRLAIFETPISQLAKFIQGHSIGDYPLCPASVYHELALAGVETTKAHLQLAFQDTYIVLRDIEYSKPLVYHESVPHVIRTSISLNLDGTGAFNVSSRVESSEETVHCFGNFKFQSTSQDVTKFSRVLPIISRNIGSVMSRSDGEMFSTRTVYEVIFPRVVEYAKEYHTMKALTVSLDGMEGYATVQLPKDHDRRQFVVHPVFMDTMLHVAGFVTNLQGGLNDAYICNKVDSVKILPAMIDNDASYGVFIRNAWIAAEGVMLSDVFAVELGASGRVVAQLKGIHFRKLRLNNFKRGLAIASGATSMQPSFPQASWTRGSVTAPVVQKSVVMPSQRSTKNVDVQAEVIRIIAETCDISASSLNVNADLATYGIDSLMSIEIFEKLQVLFRSTELNAHFLSHCESIADIVSEVTSKLTDEDSSQRTTVVDENSVELSTTSSVDEDPDVKPLLASILGVGLQDIEDDTDFEMLGLDSLTSIEAHQALQDSYGLKLPSDFFTKYTTARAVKSFISAQLHAQGSVVKEESVDMKIAPLEKISSLVQGIANPLIAALQLDTVPISVQRATVPDLAPLFLIHDGSGLVNYIKRLSPLGRDLWGIHNPHFITSLPWEGVVSMASEYAEYAVKATSKPSILGGWSFGGVVAFEAARQLLRKGIKVKGVLLIDSPSPINHVPLSDALLDFVAMQDMRTSSSVAQLVKKQFQMNSRMLGRYDPIVEGGPFPPIVLLRSKNSFNPSKVSAVPAWLADRSDEKQVVSGWESLTGTSVRCLDIPGNHFEPFHSANIEEVSRRIFEGCSYLEGLGE